LLRLLHHITHSTFHHDLSLFLSDKYRLLIGYLA
jgi:hypothetical protein